MRAVRRGGAREEEDVWPGHECERGHEDVYVSSSIAHEDEGLRHATPPL